MTYRKSTLIGIAASVTAVSLIYASAMVIGAWLKYKESKVAGPVFIEMHMHFWPIFCIAMLVFAVSFYWDFRRMSGTHI